MKRFGVLFLSLAFLFILQGFSTFLVGSTKAAQPLNILRVTPKGNDVPAGRQIVIQFNRAVVPLGRMERRADELPISVVPKLNCQWRWINTSALACQLGEKDALQPAHKYRITINPGIQAEDGATIPKTYLHQFITQRPRVTYSRFSTWRSPGTPVIRVTFNQPVFQTSVEQHIYLMTGIIITDRIPIQAEPDPNDRTAPQILPVPGESYALDFGKPLKQKSDDQLKKSQGVEARRIWLVLPKKELPLNTKFKLKVEPGLLSAEGPEKGITSRDLLEFYTFPELKFLGVSCQTNSKRDILITGAFSTLPQKCNPLARVALTFSAPVLPSQVKKHMKLVPDLAGGRTDYDPWANVYEYSHLNSPHHDGRTYNVYLPENLKAAQKYFLRIKPGTLQGEFGRILEKPVQMIFATDHRQPDYDLIHRTAVLEKKEKTEVPLYVTNMKSVTLNYKRLTPKDRRTQLSLQAKIPEAEDVAFGIPLGIREALGGQTGALYGRLSSNPHVKKSDYENALFAQVTPYAVHVKLGHFNSLVWVTELATGKPVPGATVQIYKNRLIDLSKNSKTLAQGTTDKHGLATLAGTRTMDPQLDTFGYGWYSDDVDRLFVRVDKGGDMALLPLDESRFSVSASSVSDYAVYSVPQKKYGHIKTWGTTAQGVYKAGDTIQYKLYVRNQDNRTLVPPPLTGYHLEIKDPTGKKVHEIKDVTLSEFGAYDGEFTVPKTGAVGWYWFRLTSNFTHLSWNPMRVLVSDFTPSPFRVTNELNGKLFQPGQPVTVTTMARMHAGGPYTDASTRVTAQLKQQAFVSKHPVAKDFNFRKGYSSHYSTSVFNKTDKVDDKGNLLSSFAITNSNILYGTLMVESAVRDDRGKYVASSTSAKFIGLDRFVGLKNTHWLYKEDEPAKINYIVVNERGVPVGGTKVGIQIERRVTKASRVKGAGNAYLTQFTEEWVAAGQCSGSPGAKPSTCRFTPKEPGSYRMTASIKDTEGRSHQSEIHAWVIGKGRVLWSEPNNNSLQIIPEEEGYKVGDTARYLVKNPFPGAQALVTIERYGVLHSWVETLKTSTPVIEFPVKADYVPGFYLSVVVLSPRVDKPLGEGNVDLGKPAFRMGYVSVPVKDPYKEIVVTAKAEKETYRPRDTVKVSLRAKPRHPGKKEPIELAVAVLDESVFDLIQGGSSYFDPYKGFYKLSRLDLSNFNILMGLVGRQKFEKKGANPGGGGDDSGVAMRSLFKFVSYWNPSIKTDASGKANIEFEVPDNLTGWRVLVLAVTPGDRMGLGEGNFKVNRATEVRPVMPNQVTEGDDFVAGFSVMNRTGGPRNVTVTIYAEGDIKGGSSKETKTVSLKPYKRTTVWMPIKTRTVKKDRNHPAGRVQFKVTAVDKVDKDGLIHSLPINKRRSLDTAANYGSTTKSKVEDSILFPKNIHTDVGSVSVVVSPSVIANVEGAFKYMRDYPYTCWEQILSKGVMASHYINLKGYVSDDFQWEAAVELVKNTLESAASFQAPNGGMVYFVPQDRYVSPYLSAYTALAFNWLKASGHEVPQAVEQKLHAYLENLLKRDVFPTFYNKGMSSTIRAVALAALAETGRIGKADLERYRRHVPFMDLFGKTHYLQAALKLKGTAAIAKETTEMILAHSSQTGGKFMFNETLDDSYSRILATPLRTNCAILSTWTQGMNRAEVTSLIKDIPFKMVRAITQTRGNRDHWENTQENMFCMNALVDYNKAYENTQPRMVVKAMMDRKTLGKVKFNDRRDKPTTFERPIGKSDPGRKTKMVIEKKGPGRMYYSTRVSYTPLEEHANRVNAGIEIRKEYSVERDKKWTLLKNRSEIRRGELVRVDIFVSIPTARNFVVVDDPVPGGLEPVNRDLATASIVDADKGNFKAAGSSWWFQYPDWHYFNASRWSFYHKELRHDSVRFYSDYLPAGNYVLSYTAQAIAPGNFAKMPVHAEEMYDPDVFGKGVPSKLVVKD